MARRSSTDAGCIWLVAIAIVLSPFIALFNFLESNPIAIIPLVILIAIIIITAVKVVKARRAKQQEAIRQQQEQLQQIRLQQEATRLEQDRLRKSNIKEVDMMSGLEFEIYLENLFLQQGYTVERLPASNDFGIDLILDNTWQKIAVQAKRYNGKVSSPDVQKAIGGKNYYCADECWVVTNSFYTKQAEEFAERTGAVLHDRNWLIEMACEINSNLLSPEDINNSN